MSKSKENSEAKTRVQFDITGEALEELEELKIKSGAPSRSETIRYALRILQWVIQEQKAGSKILVIRAEGEETKEITFPFLKM